MTLREMIEARNKAIADARVLNDKRVAESRDFTPEENVQWDKWNKDIDDWKDKIDADVRLNAAASEQAAMTASAGTRAAHDVSGAPPPAGAPCEFRYRPRFAQSDRVVMLPTGDEQERRSRALRAYMLGPAFAQTGQPVPAEIRALQADLDVSGGYIVPPAQFVARLIKAVDDLTFIRGLASVFPSGAEGVGIPSLDADPADADWTSELATGSEDSTMAFGKRELKPNPLAKRMKISNKLLRAAAMNPEQLAIDRLAYKFAITEEKAHLTGNGAGQPLGVFIASANGIPTSRDVSTDNTTTAPTADGIINAKYSIKAAYWPRLVSIWHRDAVKILRKLKDGDGQYLWGPGLNGGEPDRILNVPILMSEYAPNTFTTGLYVGIFGDFSFYHIADSMQMTFQRLVELYAETNQTGFIGRLESDGMPVLGEAFARVKLA